MPAARDPRVTCTFEWDTGTIQKRKTHSVRLEIPPASIALQFSKTIAKTATTKGWNFNHGLENCAVITAQGKAYQPVNALAEGFNPKLGLSGLELLQAAYVASGRLSSSTELTNTLNSRLIQSVTAPPTLAVPVDGTVATVAQNASSMSSLATTAQSNGVVADDGTVTMNAAASQTVYTQTDVNQLKQTLSSETHNGELSDPNKNTILAQIDGMTTMNVDTTYLSLVALSSAVSGMDAILNKFDYFKHKFSNGNNKLSLLGFDPGIVDLLVRDPLILLRSVSASRLSNNLRTQRQAAVQDAQSGSTGTTDWVITIYMYWQNMVFSGHFENFSLNQSASEQGLWNWSFTYVAHRAYLLKQNNILPFDRAFDPEVTEDVTRLNDLLLTDRVDALNRLLSFAGGIL